MGHTDHKDQIYSLRMHQNLPFCMEKNGQKGLLPREKLFFFASGKQFKASPPLC